MTIEKRYPTPDGYIRVENGEKGFGDFLRKQKLKPYGEKVIFYDGRQKNKKDVYDSVFDVEIGDVFIQGGSPGHAIVVVDIAANKSNEKIFLLAQSYMPAQQTQILINPIDKEMGAWYSLEGKDKLITPEWNFELSDLKRF